MSEQSPHAKLAKEAVEAYIKDRRVIGVPPGLPEDMLTTRAGTFVCMKCGGMLRGCIGTIEPTQPSIAEEIIHNAINSATQDPRFLPVECSELDTLEFTVDVLMPPEQVFDLRELDPKHYGVIVESGSRRGLLLPDLEGVDTADRQVEIARHKAFISDNESIKLYRFEVQRFE